MIPQNDQVIDQTVKKGDQLPHLKLQQHIQQDEHTPTQTNKQEHSVNQQPDQPDQEHDRVQAQQKQEDQVNGHIGQENESKINKYRQTESMIYLIKSIINKIITLNQIQR